jgi:hypothetical protein
MTFFGRSETVPIRTQQVPQAIETPVTFVSAPEAYVRFAYSRSSDSMANQIEGQDYLCFRHNDQRLAFAVCDGVGSSFCGNLAARILGDGLLDWLWSLDIAYIGGRAALMEAAGSFLNKLQKQAQHEVEAYEIPEEITGLVRQALEAQRTYGSEAIFAAARIDHPSPTIPDGLVSILWMGDTQVYALDEDGQQIDIGGKWENANRWSTVHGTRGQVGAWMRELKGVGRVAAFTDGLSAHGAKLLDYADSLLDREISAGARLPTSDDVALIDVVLRTPRYEGYPDPALPDPNAERPSLEQIWNPTGADSYELRWNWTGHGKARFMIQEASNAALSDSRVIEVPAGDLSWRPAESQEPGHYYYRVRAVNRRGIVTPWSELRQTRVAYPVPAAPSLEPVVPGGTPTLNWSDEGDSLEYTLEQAASPDFEEKQVVYSGRGTTWALPRSLPPNTYYYRVQATSDGGSSPWSEVRKVEITVPVPPTPLLSAVAFEHRHGSYELRWQPVPGAKRYELEESERERDTTEIIKLEETRYQVEDQETGEYVYRVRACHDFGCSEWSNEQLAIVAPPPPDETPTLTVAGPDDDHVVRLTWTEVPRAAEYRVEISEDEEFHHARIQNLAERELTLIRQEPGQLFFRVCGSNAGGRGPWSSAGRIAVEPDKPAWLEAKLIADQRVALTWGAVGGRATYVVEMRSGSGRGASYDEVYRGVDMQHEMPLPPKADTLTFRVRAELPGVGSEWQESAPLTVVTDELAAPRLAPPESDHTGATKLQWSAVEGATHYLLEASRERGFGDLATSKVEGTRITFHPPAKGRYWFRVRACLGVQQGPPSNSVAIMARRPSAPRLWPLDPVRADTMYEIAWAGVPGSVYYELQESPTPEFKPEGVRATRIFHPSQKIALTGRSAGRYYYRVKAVDEQDEASLWSETLVVEVR